MKPYPEEIELPFNFASIKSHFSFSKTGRSDRQTPGLSVILHGANLVILLEDQHYSLPKSEELPVQLKPDHEPLCIGYWHDKPVNVYSLPSTLEIPFPYCLDSFNSSEDRLDPATLTIAGLAKSMHHWNRQSRFCSRCGETTAALHESFGKKCAGCGTEHFPHLHPCAIVLVKRGEELLLTRKKEWAPGRYGLVAGFLDFGESLEECAIREVQEETGIMIKNVRYVASQNWPFPAQMMAGFVADYASGEIVVERHELEDARWFRRDSLPALPPKRSIARWIIDTFA